jgi:hypothetical protein
MREARIASLVVGYVNVLPPDASISSSACFGQTSSERCVSNANWNAARALFLEALKPASPWGAETRPPG